MNSIIQRNRQCERTPLVSHNSNAYAFIDRVSEANENRVGQLEKPTVGPINSTSAFLLLYMIGYCNYNGRANISSAHLML